MTFENDARIGAFLKFSDWRAPLKSALAITMRLLALIPLLTLLILPSASIAAQSNELLALAKKTGISAKNITTISASGKNIRQLSGMNERGDETKEKGLTIDVLHNNSYNIASGLRKTLGSDHMVFVSENNFGINGASDQVSVIKSNDQFDALRAMGTNAWNYDKSPKDVLKKIKEWDSKYGLIITGAGQDWIQAKFKRTPSPMMPFAKEVFEFCPDIVEQGVGTVEKLAADMSSTNTLYLWWD